MLIYFSTLTKICSNIELKSCLLNLRNWLYDSYSTVRSFAAYTAAPAAYFIVLISLPSSMLIISGRVE